MGGRWRLEEDGFGEHVVLELALDGVRAFEASFGGLGPLGFPAVGLGCGDAARGGLFFRLFDEGFELVFHFGLRSLGFRWTFGGVVLGRSAAATSSYYYRVEGPILCVAKLSNLLIRWGLRYFKFLNCQRFTSSRVKVMSDRVGG